ncbi:MAG: hypothetical protein G01um10143_52 [Parcubacteria group bacterium Gr01-1014_3]|nr:MAG: hypothetical protein G01um10143_52 [Parcubacteria group bacterium Gr01-1014_3]
MLHYLASEKHRESFSLRLREAYDRLKDDQKLDAITVIAGLVIIGNIEDARQLCIMDWDRLENLPEVGRILAKELIPKEVERVTEFRIKMEE